MFSVDYLPSWDLGQRARFFPFAAVGYTQMFGTGHAVNFGGGMDIRLNAKSGVRVEVRDYYGFIPREHNEAIRIGWRWYMED